MMDYTDAEMYAFIDEMAASAARLYGLYWDSEAARLYNLAVVSDWRHGIALQYHVLRLLGDVYKPKLVILSLAEQEFVDYMLMQDDALAKYQEE